MEVGDQLAAINGHNSMKMKVDDICRLVMNSPKSQFVELVFMRYIGPFRPAQKAMSLGSFDLEAAGSPHGSFELPPVPEQKAASEKETKGKKKGFRWFSRRKKASKGK